MKSPTELKEMFLEMAEPLLKEYVEAALGTGELSSTNSNCREEVWDLLKQLILKGSRKIKVTVTNPEDLIKAVENGTCTLQDAQDMLNLYKELKLLNKADQAEADKQINIYIEGVHVDARNTSGESPKELPTVTPLIEAIPEPDSQDP